MAKRSVLRQNATNEAKRSVLRQNAMNEAKRSVLRQNATNEAKRSVLRQNATNEAKRSVLRQNAMEKCSVLRKNTMNEAKHSVLRLTISPNVEVSFFKLLCTTDDIEDMTFDVYALPCYGLVPLVDVIQERDTILMYTYHNRLHVYVSRVELSPLIVEEQHSDKTNKNEKKQGKPSDIAKVVGKLQIFVSHTQIDLSRVLIPNDGSLEESFAGSSMRQNARAKRSVLRQNATNEAKRSVLRQNATNEAKRSVLRQNATNEAKRSEEHPFS
ncbi:hypothetical protein Tco_1039931 [Tanacetum coccineum]